MRRLGLSILLLVSLTASGCISTARMEGESMMPTIRNGDRIFIIDKGEIKRGDIIFFSYPHDTKKVFVKRVIGLPGEKLEIRAGKVIINDKITEEPYLDPSFDTYEDDKPVISIPANEYYVIGDNRANSADSRIWGTVPGNLIAGKYYMTYWNADKK